MREKLIELLYECKNECHSISCNDCKYFRKWRCSAQWEADFLIASGVVISNSETTTKWIPVTERLPEEDKDVLAFCYWHESWQVQVCHLSSNWNGQWYTSVAGQWVIVSHWQYLPQPPKGE
jgi:hypothetical protein